MNKSKKIKGTNKESVQVKKNDRIVSPKVLTIASAVLVIILVGLLLFDQFYERTYLTINGEKYKMHDLAYYFYSVETQYDYLNQMFGGSYWDMVVDENSGTTVRNMAGQDAIDSAVRNEILYKEAISEGYTLTEDEIADAEKEVTSLMEEQMSEEVIDKNNFTKDYLLDMVGRTVLVSRFRQDKIDAMDIDDEAIKAGIKFEDYRQYDIEYLYVTTETTDDDGNTVAVSEEEKAAAKTKADALYEKAKTTEDWSTLVSDDDDSSVYRKDNFIESDTTYDDAMEAMIMSMQNNQISAVYEAEDGYYIIRMLNNNSSESYDNAVEDAITSAEDDAFNDYYATVVEKYDYSINESAIKALHMGSVTLAD